VIRLSTGPAGGGFLPLGNRFAAAVGKLMINTDIQSVPSSGAVANVRAIQTGQADLAFTFADVAYMAHSGKLDSNGAVFDRVRAIALLQLTPISLVARSGLPIKSPADLRGHSVGVGPEGSATALTANLILQRYGLEASAVRLEMTSFQEAADRLLNGTLDAMFDNAINEADSLNRTIEGGGQPVPIEGSPAEELRRDYPFLRPTVITPQMYPRIGRAVHTIGVDALLICRRDLDRSLVYELTKEFFASIGRLADQGPARWTEPDQASATPIPLHDGAARYYRERELSR
jgi:TRAP transporter TAXI family solute receptor